MLKQNMIDEIVNFSKGDDRIAAVYIFGSVAQECDRSGSDLDIALIINEKIDGFDRIEMETELSNLITRDVHLVFFNSASPLLKQQILKYGKLVYEADSGQRVRQEVMARFEYFDTKNLFKELKG